ncbi:hypothetical protein ACQR35_10930 [Pseudarthrobacter sp. J1738]|uniref:hypothetical protein n=1 Tax=Pseudarthrobacter sp. J1738 TaxID=3420446 RepID=UPI003D281AAD
MTTSEVTTLDPAETDVETARDAVDAPEVGEVDTDATDGTGDAETFPREYVEKLRKENGDNRVKAKKADEYAARLHTALVRETGRLADPADLAFNADHLEDPSALAAAVDALLTAKPHLTSRKPSGDIGQGLMSESAGTVSLAGILRSNAG